MIRIKAELNSEGGVDVTLNDADKQIRLTIENLREIDEINSLCATIIRMTPGRGASCGTSICGKIERMEDR